MHLFYIDESADEKLFVVTALAVPATHWRTIYNKVRLFRLDLQHAEGIDIHYEFHAWKFVSGRGNIADRIVKKGRRCQLFQDTLRLIAALPETRLLTSVSTTDQQERGFEKLILKIQKFLESNNSYAVLICDQGKEAFYTRSLRLLQASGDADNIVEEPFYKDSAHSYFVQLSDFCAYALLRQEHPLASKTKYGLDQAFKILASITAPA